MVILPSTPLISEAQPQLQLQLEQEQQPELQPEQQQQPELQLEQQQQQQLEPQQQQHLEPALQPQPQIYHKKQKPAWLDSFLHTDFLGACSIHQGRKSELNIYCINCDAGMCETCISAAEHNEHEKLQIYKHVHKDAVMLTDIQKFIDCAQIQPYRCNGRKVLAINPLPHSGRELHYGERCKVCNRTIFKPSIYSYCSISCKVTAVSEDLTSVTPPYLAPKKPNRKPQPRTSTSKPVSPLRRVNKRKGVPHRAPFF